MLLRDVI